jgi:membrane protein YdbS with pleckstrin-like domain
VDALRLAAVAILALGVFYSFYRMYDKATTDWAKFAHLIVILLLLVAIFFVIPTRQL